MIESPKGFNWSGEFVSITRCKLGLQKKTSTFLPHRFGAANFRRKSSALHNYPYPALVCDFKFPAKNLSNPSECVVCALSYVVFLKCSAFEINPFKEREN